VSAGEAPAATVIGVCGAGTMGSGIAQLAAQSGARTLLQDPMAEQLPRAQASIEKGLRKTAEKGRISEADAEAAIGRLETVEQVDAFADCDLVIEAAPERLDLKHELYGRLSEIVSEDCVLATNTSSLPVTAIATGATHPERVVGMHFFNPAPLMKLLEVIAGDASDDRSLALARATGEAMGKHVIDAADGPGFLVNRCGRPWGLEALKLVQERLATVEQIDRIARMSAGFRMGPFELMDLVGVDTGLDVAKSFYELSFGEPRWRPSTIAARMVAAGRHGRKTGRGYYDYPEGGSHREPDPEPPAAGEAGTGDGLVVVAGDGAIAQEIRAAASEAGWQISDPAEAIDGADPWLIVDCGADPEDPPLQGAPQLILCAEGSLGALDPEGSAAGFHALVPFAESKLVEMTKTSTTSSTAIERGEHFFASLGKTTEWVGDAPGLVLGRIVCQLVNEAAFALGEGVGSAEDIDAGMTLGLNHPHGPLAWGDAIGLDHVLSVLDALADEYREERYRAAPALRRAVMEGRLGAATGEGFF
jgi:3-hydroxybutyryl-CoA dehydrogenase